MILKNISKRFEIFAGKKAVLQNNLDTYGKTQERCHEFQWAVVPLCLGLPSIQHRRMRHKLVVLYSVVIFSFFPKATFQNLKMLFHFSYFQNFYFF